MSSDTAADKWSHTRYVEAIRLLAEVTQDPRLIEQLQTLDAIEHCWGTNSMDTPVLGVPEEFFKALDVVKARYEASSSPPPDEIAKQLRVWAIRTEDYVRRMLYEHHRSRQVAEC
jgi:hypothetical protein